MQTSRRTRRILGVALVASLMATQSACTPRVDTYVALGDSYTSGPGITTQVAGPSSDPNGDLGSPAGCMRSDRNYPTVARADLAAAGITFARFWDFSCSGAQTEDFYTGQSTDNGTNQPQLNAIGSATKVVTIGIGGNDIGFSDIIKGCVAYQSCKSDYVHDGIDELRDRIDALAPTIAQLVTDVHTRGPQAKVFVIGYPAILPHSTGVLGCQTMTQSDVAYLDGVQQYLNAMLQTQAQANDATFVDLYTPSVGHDACASDPWVNGLVAIPPVHPNATGMAQSAQVVANAIQTELAS